MTKLTVIFLQVQAKTLIDKTNYGLITSLYKLSSELRLVQ